MSEVTAIPVWRAAHEFAGDALIVRASDYDALRAEFDQFKADRREALVSINEESKLVKLAMEALRAENERLHAELAALKAVQDGVEVVAESFTMEAISAARGLVTHIRPTTDLPAGTKLMTVTQHNAIVASLSPENQRTVPASPLLADRHPMEARQPVADEREAFEVWAGENHFGTRRPFANANNYESGYTDFCWKAWQARAALSAPAAGHDVSALVDALGQTRIDLVILRGSFAQAAKYDHKAEGMDDEIGKWIGRIDAALAAHKAGGGQP